MNDFCFSATIFDMIPSVHGNELTRTTRVNMSTVKFFGKQYDQRNLYMTLSRSKEKSYWSVIYLFIFFDRVCLWMENGRETKIPPLIGKIYYPENQLQIRPTKIVLLIMCRLMVKNCITVLTTALNNPCIDNTQIVVIISIFWNPWAGVKYAHYSF